MSRKGNCIDNGSMESFFGKLKNEMFYGYEYEFDTIDKFIKAIDEYIYIYYYNNKRIKVKNKGLSPITYKQQSLNRLSL